MVVLYVVFFGTPIAGLIAGTVAMLRGSPNPIGAGFTAARIALVILAAGSIGYLQLIEAGS